MEKYHVINSIIHIKVTWITRPRFLTIFAKINTAPGAENFFGYRGEYEHNKGVRAEFWAE